MVAPARIVSHYSGSVSVHLFGELDLVTAPALREQFARALSMSSDLVVDLREVTFLDAAVIAALLSAQQQALVQGGSLILIEATPWVEKVLHASRATMAIPLLPHRTDASRSQVHQHESRTSA